MHLQYGANAGSRTVARPGRVPSCPGHSWRASSDSLPARPSRRRGTSCRCRTRAIADRPRTPMATTIDHCSPRARLGTGTVSTNPCDSGEFLQHRLAAAGLDGAVWADGGRARGRARRGAAGGAGARWVSRPQVAGRQLRPGMEREMALDFLSQLGSSAGMHAPGAGSGGARSGSPMGAAAGSIGLAAGMGGPRRWRDGLGRRESAHQLVLRAHPRDTPGRHPVVLEPGRPVVVRGPRGGAVAGR